MESGSQAVSTPPGSSPATADHVAHTDKPGGTAHATDPSSETADDKIKTIFRALAKAYYDGYVVDKAIDDFISKWTGESWVTDNIVGKGTPGTLRGVFKEFVAGKFYGKLVLDKVLINRLPKKLIPYGWMLDVPKYASWLDYLKYLALTRLADDPPDPNFTALASPPKLRALRGAPREVGERDRREAALVHRSPDNGRARSRRGGGRGDHRPERAASPRERHRQPAREPARREAEGAQGGRPDGEGDSSGAVAAQPCAAGEAPTRPALVRAGAEEARVHRRRDRGGGTVSSLGSAQAPDRHPSRRCLDWLPRRGRWAQSALRWRPSPSGTHSGVEQGRPDGRGWVRTSDLCNSAFCRGQLTGADRLNLGESPRIRAVIARHSGQPWWRELVAVLALPPAPVQTGDGAMRHAVLIAALHPRRSRRRLAVDAQISARLHRDALHPGLRHARAARLLQQPAAGLGSRRGGHQCGQLLHGEQRLEHPGRYLQLRRGDYRAGARDHSGRGERPDDRGGASGTTLAQRSRGCRSAMSASSGAAATSLASRTGSISTTAPTP